MFKILRFLALCMFLSNAAGAQIFPREEAKLNYRIIGFSFPSSGQQNANYTLEIASGHINIIDSFKKSIIKSQVSKNNKIIAEVPAFGGWYTWRIVSAANNNTSLINGELHHFSTLSAPNVDTTHTRLRIINPAVKYKDAYVFLDGNAALYDMKGNPVWFLPDLNGINDGNDLPNDLKMSNTGTITLMLRNQVYEINYNGDVLWKGPNNGKVNGESMEHYHHEFTKLSNGHYMVLGSEAASMTNDMPADPKPGELPGIKLPMGTLIEYDKQGNIVWSWKASSYYPKSDLQYYSRPNADNIKIITDPHENGFFFDEKNKNIYISCKNISRVLKVKYPEGKVINNYGEIYKPGVPSRDNGLFCHQHSSRYSPRGYVYLFNNNTCQLHANTPTILKLQEPGPGTGQLKKIWEYDFNKEGHYLDMMSGGGNVIELPDGSMFVCMGNQYGKTLIIGEDKKTLWSAFPEKWSTDENKWIQIPEYRGSVVLDKKELEKMIWNEEKP